MKEIHINLTVTAMTLAVVCSIGALAEGLGKSLGKRLYQPGTERFAFEYKMPKSAAPVPMKIADGEPGAAPAPAKAAMN